MDDGSSVDGRSAGGKVSSLMIGEEVEQLVPGAHPVKTVLVGLVVVVRQVDGGGAELLPSRESSRKVAAGEEGGKRREDAFG